MKWFQHQAKAHADTKLQKVLMKYGFEGYGLYWYCIESICQNLEPRLTFELEHDSEILAHIGRMDSRIVEEVMLYMVNIGLFTESQGHIVCRTIARYLGDSLTRNEALKSIIREEKSLSMSETVSDNLRLSHGQDRTGQDRTGQEKDKSKSITSSPKGDNTTPFAKVVDLYHEILPSLPSVKLLSNKRRASIRQRHQSIMEKDLDNWAAYFNAVSRSDFLMGRVDGKQWRADFDFLITEKATVNTLEGKYHA